MSVDRTVVVYGAYGHTGRFVVAELLERGWIPILSGRDAGKLAALSEMFPGLERRPASVEDPVSLDRALDGAMGVINCAGPFLDSAAPMIEAALRARIHYLDVSAEQQAVLDVFERFSGAAKAAAVTVVPAMAFYGGLADLLATAALDDWPDADAIDVAVALDSWHPTVGTRLTGARNRYRRLVVAGGKLEPLADPPPSGQWMFPAPFGTQDTIALPFSEIVTLSRHVRSTEVHSYMNLAPLKDLRDPHTPPPTPTDAHGRSSQTFMVETRVRRGSQTRSALASGRDIYAVTAPLVVEAIQRIGGGRVKANGVVAPGQAFDARGFLESLPALDLVLPGA
ncbi:MAG TPA: saccharopine dehydrogenase NADP-binding domain-containing protein [Pseudoxanthomonas sp.]